MLPRLQDVARRLQDVPRRLQDVPRTRQVLVRLSSCYWKRETVWKKPAVGAVDAEELRAVRSPGLTDRLPEPLPWPLCSRPGLYKNKN